jgi:hypothetical protein
MYCHLFALHFYGVLICIYWKPKLKLYQLLLHHFLWHHESNVWLSTFDLYLYFDQSFTFVNRLLFTRMAYKYSGFDLNY